MNEFLVEIKLKCEVWNSTCCFTLINYKDRQKDMFRDKTLNEKYRNYDESFLVRDLKMSNVINLLITAETTF